MQPEADLQRRRQQAEENAARQRRLLPNPFAGLKFSGPSNEEMEGVFRTQPGMRDVALGENYGSRPSLYNVQRQGNSVNVSPFQPARQTWDERLPSGQSVQDLLRSMSGRPNGALPQIRPQTPVADITAPPPSQPSQPSPRLAVSSQPSVGITGSLNFPQPTTEVRSIDDVPLPSQPLPVAQPVSVGTSIRGMNKLERDLALREALSTSDPESKVRTVGGQIDISPPPMKGTGVEHRGRFATAGEAALNAFGSADPDHPLYSLGQGLGASITGLASPRAGAKLNRRFDISRLDSDIARGLKLEEAKSGLSAAEALRRQREAEPYLRAQEIDFRNQQLELERQKNAGEIDWQTYQKERDRLDRESRERIAGMSHQNDPEARGAKVAAARQEYDSLVSEEEVARQEKERAYKALSDARSNPSLAKEDIAQIESSAKMADEYYRSFAGKKRDAQTRIRENQYGGTSTVSPIAPPPGVTEASVRAEARRRGADAEAAVKKARDLKWIQ